MNLHTTLPPTVEVQPCVDGDTDELVALFRRCYDERPAIFQPRTRASWSWKYAENPLGHHSLVAREAGAAVAFVGGVPSRFWCGGRERLTIQATDHMVDPPMRGSAAGHLFRHLMSTWLDRHCRDGTHFMAWGFPSRRDFSIGERYCEYERVGPVEPLIHTSVHTLGRHTSAFTVATLPPGDEELDELWHRCRAKLPMTHDRGASFLRWRYAEHPARDYHLLALRDPDGRLRAVTVLCAGGLADDTVLLLEWLVEAHDEEAERALLAVAGRRALELSCGSLAVWLAPWQPAWRRLEHLGFRPESTALCHTAQSWASDVPLDDVRAQCAWNLGDVDFL